MKRLIALQITMVMLVSLISPAIIAAETDPVLDLFHDSVFVDYTVGDVFQFDGTSYNEFDGNYMTTPGDYALALYYETGSEQFVTFEELTTTGASLDLQLYSSDFNTLTVNDTGSRTLYELGMPLDEKNEGFVDTNLTSNTVQMKSDYYDHLGVSLYDGSYLFTYMVKGETDALNLTQALTLNFSNSHSLSLHNTSGNISISDPVYFEDELHIEDTYGNFLGLVEIIGGPDYIELPMEVTVYDTSGNELDSYPYTIWEGTPSPSDLSAYNEGDYQLSLRVMNGSVVVLETAKVPVFFSKSDNGSDITGLSFNSDAGYFEFTTGNYTYTDHNNLHIGISGEMVNGFMPDYIYRSLLTGDAVEFVKMDGATEVPITFDDVYSNISSDPYPGSNKFELSIMSGTSFGITANTTYRVKINSSYALDILSLILDHIYDSGQGNNFYVDLAVATDYEWMDSQHGSASLYGSVVNNDSVPIHPYLINQRTLQVTGDDIIIKFNEFTRNSSTVFGELVFEGTLRDGASTDLTAVPAANLYNIYGTEATEVLLDENVPFTLNTSASVPTYAYTSDSLAGINTTGELIYFSDNGDLDMLVADYLNQDKSSAHIYLILRDSNGDVVGFEIFEEVKQILKTDPELVFDETANTNGIFLTETPIRIENMDQGYVVMLKNAGLAYEYRLLVNGIVEDRFGNNRPFVITLNNIGDGNFSGYFNLRPYNDSDLNLAEGDLLVQNSTAQKNYRIADWGNIETYDTVPLFSGDKNTVTMSYMDEGNNLSTELIFATYPGSREDIFSYDRKVQQQIGGNATTFTFELDHYYGNDDAMTFEIRNGDTVVASFNEVQSSLEFSETVDDGTGNTWTDYYTQFIMALGTEGFNNLDTLDDMTYIDGVILYSDTYDANPDKAYESLDFEYYLTQIIQVDNHSVENIQVDFQGNTIRDSQSYYVFKVYLNDQVYYEDLNLTQFTILDKNMTDLGIAPELIEPYFYSSDQNIYDPISEVLLFFPENDALSDSYLEADGIVDISGNTMTGPVTSEIWISTDIRSYLTNTDGTILGNRELILVGSEDLTEVTEAVLAGQSFDYLDQRYIHVGSDGAVNTQLKPGTYHVIEVRKEISGDWVNESNPNFQLTIPVLSYEQYQSGYSWYDGDIVLPADNLKGNVYRSSDYELSEKLLFMEQGDLQDLFMTLSQKMFDGMLTDDEWQALDFIVNHYLIEITTDDYGAFTGTFGPGTYDLLGRVLGNDYYNVESPLETVAPFTVTDRTIALAPMTDILFSEPNTFIQIIDGSGEPLNFVNATLELLSEDQEWYIMTNENGMIVGNFDLGDYALTSLESSWESKGDGYLFADDTDSITFSKTDTETVQEIELQLPPANTAIYFAVDGNPVDAEYSHLQLNTTDPDMDLHMSANARSGKYEANLPAGDYVIDSYFINNTSNDSLNQSFTLATTNAAMEVIIDLSGEFNAYVQLLDDEGNGLEGYYLEIHDPSSGNWYDGETNSDGIHYFYVDITDMTDALEIEIKGYSINGKWTSFEGTEFMTVPVTASATNRASHQIVLLPPNFRGSVIDSDGSKLFRDGWIHIENLLDGYGFGSQIDWEGNFVFSIEEEGDYMVRSAGKDFDSMDIQFSFRVVLIEGKYVVQDLDSNTIPMPVELGEVQPNLYGYLYKSGTTPYPTNGDFMSMLIKDTSVDDETYNQRPWFYQIWVDVDTSTGEFGIKVDPTKNYEAVAVSTQEDWYEFGSPVSLDLDSENIVRPPAHLFNGSVQDYEGNPAVEGDLWIERLLDYENYWTNVDRDGSFGINVTPGTYTLRDVNYRTETMSEWTYMQMNRKFTVADTSTPVTMIIQPNLKGMIQLDDLLAEDVRYMGMQLRPVYENTDFDSTEDYENYLNNPWEYTFHVDAVKYDDGTNQYALFYTYLDDGLYLIENMYIDNRHIEMNLEFELAGTLSSDNITYANDKYLLDQNFSPNVSGALVENGVPLADAWVNFVKLNDDGTENWEDPNAWFGTSTDSSGVFRLNLTEGTYMLEGYHTKGEWVDFVWQPGKYVQINKKFKVDGDGNLTDMDNQPLTDFNVTTNVTGSVQFVNGLNQYEDLNDAWINFVKVDENDAPLWDSYFWTNTGYEDNDFSMYLEPGRYMVQEAGSFNTWFRDGQIFDVPESGDAAPLEVKPEIPNFIGSAYMDSSGTQPLSWGWIAVKPAGTSVNDWRNVLHIQTDKSGHFSINIPDGDWVIAEMGNNMEWMQLRIEFSVLGDSVTGFSQDSNGVIVSPPEPNVAGVVLDEEGNTVNDWAWIAIKPAGADPFDWSENIWIENRELEPGIWGFEAFMANGDYRIVEASGPSFFYRTDITFTISDNSITDLIVSLPEPNIAGTVYKDADGLVLADIGWVSIIRVDADGNQVKHDGTAIGSDSYKDPYSDVYWAYSFGAEIGTDGTFALKLDEGNYKVIGVDTWDSWYKADTAFAVGSDAAIVTVTRPGPNVTVTVTDVPADILSDHGFLSVYRTVEDYRLYEDIPFVSVNGSTYTFEGRIPPDTYTVEFFATMNGEMLIGDTLTIESGLTSVASYSVFDETKAVVTGTVTVDSQPVTKRLWLTIEETVTAGEVKVQTDQDGNFAFVLEIGTQWKPVRIADDTELRDLANASSFSVTGDGSVGTINLID